MRQRDEMRGNIVSASAQAAGACDQPWFPALAAVMASWPGSKPAGAGLSDQVVGKLSWAIPVMRGGFAGRGIIYLAVAVASLCSLWRGGQAQDTSSALGWLENTWSGGALLFLILLGMLAYAAWRVLDAAFDLENYGADAKGIAACLGMVVTGAAHLAIGITAFTLLFQGREGGEGSIIPRYVGLVMSWPG